MSDVVQAIQDARDRIERECDQLVAAAQNHDGSTARSQLCQVEEAVRELEEAEALLLGEG